MDPPSTSCHTIEEVIDEMRRRWRGLQRAGDWRAVFAKTYLRTTEQILVATQTAGVFENPAWIVEFDCDFAGRYFDAFDRFEAGADCPLPWRLAFDGAVAKRTLIIQDVLLGMNAHINYDLPHSLHATVPADVDGDGLEAYRRDNLVLNTVLASSIDVVERAVAREYDFMLHAADVALCGRDEQFAGEMIKAWRARSWSSFVVLRSTSDVGPGERLIEESAVDNAVLMLQLQRAFPVLYWPNRLWRDTLAAVSRLRGSSR